MARFAFIGDMATTSATALPAVATMVKGWNPTHIISTGDNNNDDDTNYESTVGQYFHEYLSPYNGTWGAGSSTGNRFWPVIGNHDWDANNAPTTYTNYFTLPGNERYYNVRFDNVEFFMLNSDAREPDGNTATSVQGQWLQAALAASTATWKLVVAHHSPYTSTTSADNQWMRWPFKQWGASAIITGHQHVYERLSVDGLPYIVNTTAGSFLSEWGEIDPNSIVRYDSQAGAIQMDAEAASLTFRFFNRSAAQIDTYTITLPNVPNAPSNLRASPYSASRIDLSWTDNTTTEANFLIERSPDGVSNWTQIATPATDATTYSDTSATLLPGVTYYYRVRAAAGAQSPNSNVASATTLPPGYVNFVAPGGTWKYLDSGIDQGTVWRGIGFDDSTWFGGRAQFGYGDGDEATVVSFGPNANAKHITTYFRKGFTVQNASQVTQLDLRLLRDDGAVVYLNGTEVWRNNMPTTGAIGFGTVASSSISGTAEASWLGLTITPALLVTGNNVVAVEIHQDRPDSSDLSFDFALVARLAAAIAPPSAFKATAVAHNQVNLSWIDTVVGETGFKIERSTNGTDFTQIGTAAAGATTYTDNTAAGSTQYWYRARSASASGDSRSSSVAIVTTPATPNALPAGWSGTDIGAVAAAGSATHNAGVFTVNGSGAGIGGTADEFHFVSRSWTGNGTIIARVGGITNTNAAAKAGIMFRETRAAGAREVSISVTPAGTIVVMGRSNTNGNSAGPPIVTGVTTPIWLKLVRNANFFTPQYSTNGTTWTSIPGASFTLTANVFVGLCVTSTADGTIATGTFDNVSVTSTTTLSSAADDNVTTPTNPGKNKWNRKTAMREQLGLNEDPLDLLV